MDEKISDFGSAYDNYLAGMKAYGLYQTAEEETEEIRYLEKIILCINMKEDFKTRGASSSIKPIADAAEVPESFVRGVRSAMDDAGDLGGRSYDIRMV